MAVAALPMAATHTGAAGAPAARKRGAHAAPAVDARKPRLQQRRAASARRGSLTRRLSLAPAHDFELAAPLAARQLGGIRALELQPLEVLRA